jgi:hypothetical protein
MKGLILTALGTASLTGGGAYAYIHQQEALVASLRADNAQLAGKLNTRTAAIDQAIKILQDARR